MDETLRKEIESLCKLTSKELKRRYRELFGEDSPSFNRQHLFRRIAWRLQAMRQGDLSDRARERAEQLAENMDLRLRAPRRFWDELMNGAGERRRDPRLPSAGTVLKRSYRGQMIVVTVLDQGFCYERQNYGSLSAIAYRVTGTRWNGFLFFGLTKDTEA